LQNLEEDYQSTDDPLLKRLLAEARTLSDVEGVCADLPRVTLRGDLRGNSLSIVVIDLKPALPLLATKRFLPWT
jgi:hypothetical protein